MGRQAVCRAAAMLALAALVVFIPARGRAQETGGISGRVTRAGSGSGLWNITVEMTDVAGMTSRSATTDVDGRFTIAGLAPGFYFARTRNALGYLDELFHEFPCVDWCTFGAGTPIPITAGAVTGYVDFTLRLGGQISGSVTDATTGAAIAGVRVRVATPSGQERGSATSDGTGRYTVTGLMDGDYLVRTDSSWPAYLDEVYPGVSCVPSCPWPSGTPVQVVSENTTGNIDFPLSRAGRITGRVTDATTGQPLGGISLRAEIPATWQQSWSAQSDANGHYEIGGLIDGSYRVVADVWNGQYASEVYDDVTCPLQNCQGIAGTPVSVTVSTTTAGIDFDLMRAGRISGVVRSASDGTPLAGIQVEVVRLDETVSTSISATDGTYVVTGIPNGTFYVRARGRSVGYLDQLFDSKPCSSSSCPPVTGTPVSVVAPSITSGIDFDLALGGTIHGTVTREADGTSIQGAGVYLYAQTGGYVRSTSANSAGEYEFPGLEPGSYFVLVQHAGFANELFDNLACASGTCAVTSGTPVVVAAATSVDDIDVALAAVPTGRITGTVTEVATGSPLAGVSVVVRSTTQQWVNGVTTDASGRYDSGELLVGSYTVHAQTTSDGHAGELFDNVPCPDWNCDNALATAVSVLAGTTADKVDFALLPGGHLTGQVTDATTGARLAGAMVEVFNASGSNARTMPADANGVYDSGGLVAGIYYVRATSPGYLPELFDDHACTGWCSPTSGTPVTVASGATTSGIDIALLAGGRVSGRVVDAVSLLPLEGVTVQLRLGDWSTSTTTGSDGHYEIGGLASGSYVLKTNNWRGYLDELYDDVLCAGTCDETQGTAVTVVVRESVTGIDVALMRGGRLTGHVTDGATGAPVSGFQVSLFDAAGRQVAYASTDQSGAYLVTDLVTGSYFVRFGDSGGGYPPELYDNLPCPNGTCYLPAGTPVIVRAGATTGSVDAALSAVGAIAGRVTDAGSTAPLRLVWVFVTDSAQRQVGAALTDASGSYEVKDLPIGKYTVSVMTLSDFIDEVFDGVPCDHGCPAAGATPVIVSAYETTGNINFTLDRGGRITGKVAEAITGRRLSGVDVDIYDAQGVHAAQARSGTEGTYVSPGLRAGTYFVRASGGGDFEPRLFEGLACRGSCLVTSGTPVTIVTATDTPGIDFSMQPAGAAAPLMYYLGEGATGDFFDMDVAIANPNPVVAPVTMRFLKPGGAVVSTDLVVGARQQVTIRVDDVPGLEATPVSVEITSTDGVPLVVERTMMWDGNGYGGHGAVAVDGPATRWYFAEGSQGFFDTYLLLANPGSAASEVTVTFLRETGLPFTTRVRVEASARATMFAGRYRSLPGSRFRSWWTRASPWSANGPCTSAPRGSGTVGTKRPA